MSEQVTFHLRPLTATDAQAIDQWRYPEPYHFYDLEQDEADRAEFLDAPNWPDRYFAVTGEEEELIGFFVFEPGADGVEIALGMDPAYTGRGWGLAFLQAGLAFARRCFDPDRFHLSVAAFNRRAIIVYQRAGFEITRTFTQFTNGASFEFVEMEKDENS